MGKKENSVDLKEEHVCNAPQGAMAVVHRGDGHYDALGGIRTTEKPKWADGAPGGDAWMKQAPSLAIARPHDVAKIGFPAVVGLCVGIALAGAFLPIRWAASTSTRKALVHA